MRVYTAKPGQPTTNLPYPGEQFFVVQLRDTVEIRRKKGYYILGERIGHPGDYFIIRSFESVNGGFDHIMILAKDDFEARYEPVRDAVPKLDNPIDCERSDT